MAGSQLQICCDVASRARWTSACADSDRNESRAWSRKTYVEDYRGVSGSICVSREDVEYENELKEKRGSVGSPCPMNRVRRNETGRYRVSALTVFHCDHGAGLRTHRNLRSSLRRPLSRGPSSLASIFASTCRSFRMPGIIVVTSSFERMNLSASSGIVIRVSCSRFHC